MPRKGCPHKLEITTKIKGSLRCEKQGGKKVFFMKGSCQNGGCLYKTKQIQSLPYINGGRKLRHRNKKLA